MFYVAIKTQTVLEKPTTSSLAIFTERNCYIAHVNAPKNILRKKTTPKILRLI